jgi:Tfp pilus assembly PilM family ATPase/Tfp pilus assembly protein PilN
MSKGVGVYIGRNEVIAVSAVRTAAGPQITSFAIEHIGPEDSQSSIDREIHRIKRMAPEAQAILRALAKIREHGAFVNVAVSPLQVVTRNFIMPMVPKKDELGAVRNEASRYVPFKITDSVLDYHAYPTHKNVLSVTVTAIRSEILSDYLENLRSASAKVIVVEPIYNAASRVFSALNRVGGKVQTHGFVILQSDGNVNVTLASKGIVYLSRDFLLSGKLDEDKTRFHSELKASMEYFYKLTGGESIEQIFLSGVGDLKIWVEHLEHAFDYKVRFDVANLPRAKGLPPEALHELLVAFGLALRSLGYRSSLGNIQLLPKEERRSDPQQFLKFLIVEFFLVLILLVIVRFVAFQPYLMNMRHQKKAMMVPAEQEFPNFAARSMEDLAREKGELTQRMGKVDRFFNDKISVAAFLAALGQGLPKSISVDYISIEDATSLVSEQSGKAQKRLNIRGICYLGSAEKETETVTAWLKALGAKKIMADNFSEIRVEEIKREKFRNRDITRFRGLGE